MVKLFRPHSKRLQFFVISSFIIFFLCCIPYISAVGNDNNPKYILLRLEDIGPGGQYEGPEQLGKLRAVLELLREHGVRYQLAVIPRWIQIDKEGNRYDVALDHLVDPYVHSFLDVLKEAEAGGAVIGMHGYTHQVGNVRRDDGQHESGIGNEFDVSDVEETLTPSFAQSRMEQGIQVFKGAGLQPKFWEAPHYHTKSEQDAVFRSYFGLNYQADVQKDRNTGRPQYMNVRNTGHGASSLGSVYVPTPFSYIPYNRDADIIVNQLDKSERLPSFFFHPFLEFKYLTPVIDQFGDPVLKDGIPLYEYPSKAKSILQKLLPQLEQKTYKFISLTDYIPFAPAKSVRLESTLEGGVQVADVNGDRQGDVIQWDGVNGEIKVTPGEFNGYRNEPVGEASVWARIPYKTGDVWTVFDDNGDGRSDLWILHADGQLNGYHAGKSSFEPFQSYKIGKSGWSDLFALNQGKDGWVLAGQSMDQTRLEAVALTADSIKPLAAHIWEKKPSQLTIGDLDGNGKEELIIPFSRSSRWVQLSPQLQAMKWDWINPALELPTGESGNVKIGDYNGDGKQDVLFWNRAQQSFAVYEQVGPFKFQYLSRMGPWGPKKGKLLIADLNGDGRKDLAITNGEEPYLDTALSWESANFLTSGK